MTDQDHNKNLENVKDLLTNTKDKTENFEKDDIEKNKTIAALAYLIFFLPLICCPNSKFARFHANQGLDLLFFSIASNIVLGVITNILLSITWRLAFLWSLFYGVLSLVMLLLLILGIMNALNGKAKELPVIGKFTIIK